MHGELDMWKALKHFPVRGSRGESWRVLGVAVRASCATPLWNAALPRQMEASAAGLFELNPGLCKSLVNSLPEGGLH